MSRPVEVFYGDRHNNPVRPFDTHWKLTGKFRVQQANTSLWCYRLRGNPSGTVHYVDADVLSRDYIQLDKKP